MTETATADTTARIEPAFKARWVEALRSGRYVQTSGALRVTKYFDQTARPAGYAYCCLGVACDLIDPRLWESSVWDEVNFGLLYSESAFAGLGTTADNFDNAGRIRDITARKTPVVYLAGLNDAGFTFAQIADVIDFFL